TFPFVTPTSRPTMLNTSTSACRAESPPPCGGGDQHLVDGGYYENSGLVGAIEWIDDALTDLANPAKNLKQYPVPRGILLLAIEAFERPTDPEGPCQPTQTAPAAESP